MTKVGEFFSFSCCISLKQRQIKSRRRHTLNRKVRTCSMYMYTFRPLGSTTTVTQKRKYFGSEWCEHLTEPATKGIIPSYTSAFVGQTIYTIRK